jgi:hypothetical protein
MGLRRLLVRIAAVALGVALLPSGCAQGTPPTGAQIEVVNGDGVPPPKYLLFDWQDSSKVLVDDRRVPSSGNLDPNARPLAVVRIAADSVTDPQRRIVIRGMVDELVVSQGEASLHIEEGSWQAATVVLVGSVAPTPDGGAPPDGSPSEGGVDPMDAAGDQAPVDAGAADAADAGPPIDVAPVDAPPDLSSPDLPRDLAPDAPLGPVTLAAIADSYAEQGQTSSGTNFGKATTLEVKSQAGADNSRTAFLRFSLTSLAGTTPVVATLRVYGKATSGTNMVSAHAVNDDAWTETGITWNNKPALGMKLSTVSVGTTNQYREWNVTAFVKLQQMIGRDTVNFALNMDNDTQSGPDTYNSREAASNQPQLVIAR